MNETENSIRSYRTIDRSFLKRYIERVPYLMRENRHRFSSENYEKLHIPFRIYIYIYNHILKCEIWKYLYLMLEFLHPDVQK